MHIAFYSPEWPPAKAANGIVTYVAAMRDYLLAQGHEVSVLTLGRMIDSTGRDQDMGIGQDGRGIVGRARRFLERHRGDLPCLGRALGKQFQALHRLAPLDLIEMEESFGWSEIVRRTSQVPVVTRLHGPFFLKPDEQRSNREVRADSQRRKAEGIAIVGATSLTAPTMATLERTCLHYGRSLSKQAAAIPNPIAMANDSWRLDACDRNHILMVGRFDHPKGADTILLAFNQLIERRPAARLTLVGPDMGMQMASGAMLSFGDYVATHLSPLARRQVRFTGRLSPSAITRLRREALVTAQCSRLENFPYTLTEGLSAGCPMISTDWAGAEEIIAHGENGLLTPVGDPDAMAANLEWMLDHPEEIAAMGDRAQAHCRAHFSTGAVGSRMVDWYRTTIAESRR